MAKAKKIIIKDNMTNTNKIIIFGAEFVGTALLVLIGCMSCISDIVPGMRPAHLQICFAFGLAVMVAIQCVGHISGSHINPIVTLAAVILGHISVMLAPIYIVAQMAGALAGFGLLKLATPIHIMGGYTDNNTIHIPGACSPGISPNISTMQGLLVEFLISAILVLVCCGVWDCRNKMKEDSVPIRFGFTITVLAIAAGPYTGANMNPARSFAPALFNGDWNDQWIYWLGPIAGSICAATIYRYFFSKEEDIQQTTNNATEVLPLNENKV